MIQLHTYDTQNAMQAAVVAAITREANRSAGSFTMGLSGGSTPRPVYETLAGSTKLNWQNARLFQVDERYVPSNHPDSNTLMIRQSLLSKLQPAPAFTFFDTSVPIATSLKQYEDQLHTLQKHAFDLILLGMGQDGHIASLFPGSKALQETQQLTALTRTRRFSVNRRLTVTPPVILNSRMLFLLLKGADKASALDRLIHGKATYRNFPAMLLHQHNDAHIFYAKC